MNEKFKTLIEILIKINHPTLQKYVEIENEEDIKYKLKQMKLDLEQSLINLYLLKGGINGSSLYDGSFVELFSFGNFISINSATSLLLLDRKTLKIYNKKLPFIQSLTGDTISIDLDIKSSTKGMLLLFSPSLNLSSNFVTVYDSVEKWIETIIKCYETNIYRLNSNKILEIDYKKEKEISKNINVNSDFWK